MKAQLLEIRSNSTADSSQVGGSKVRGSEGLELIRKLPSGGLEDYILNDHSDFDIDVSPGTLREELERFNELYCD